MSNNGYTLCNAQQLVPLSLATLGSSPRWLVPAVLLQEHWLPSRLCDVMVLGLAKALMTMRKGERARVLVQPEYAFGKMGCAPRIPGNATILYEVELLHFVDAEDALELEGISVDGGPMPFPKLLEVRPCCI